MKINKIITRIAGLSLVTVSVMYATGIVKLNHAPQELNYANMSTTHLQAEVERLSLEDELPFEMGLELMDRWTHK